MPVPEAPRPATRTAIIGIGSMGKGLAYQAGLTPDVTCVGLADCRLTRAIACAEFLGRPYQVVTSAAAAADAIRAGTLAIAEDGLVLAECEAVDVLLESSSDIVAGGRYALRAIASGRSVVMMNAEADLIFGPYLAAEAKRQGVVYTSSDGDQHGVIARLVRELTFLGFELVMAGNMKGYLDRRSNAETIRPEADKRNIDYRMAAGYTDGSKLCIEQALVANAFGLRTLRPGMVGPRVAHVKDVLQEFDFDAIRRQGAVVDYVLGAQPDGGVFAVGYTDNAYQQSMLSMLKMGPGPYYVFYRPYHLCHVEAMGTVIDAARGQALLQPYRGFRTNVYAYAKVDLAAGQVLDGVGGDACYGLIENVDTGGVDGVPLCLLEGMTLLRAKRSDERLTMADVTCEANREGDRMFALAVAAAANL